MLYAFTSCALNYTPKSRALLESLRKYEPDLKVCLALGDEIGVHQDEIEDMFDHVFALSDFPELNTPSWIFKHRIVELCTAIKPFVLRRILDLPDCEGVFYFDPDMVVFEELTDMINDMKSHNIVLTPHLTDPEATLRGIEDNELSALKHGAYNLGYIGVRNTDEGRRFADWWSHRLKHYCREDIPAGIFTDQKWIDLVPGLFEGVHIMRHPGYNVASWNMTNRYVKKVKRMKYTVNEQPLVFYHFTGFDSGAHDVMSEIYSKGNSDVAELIKWYRDRTGELAKEPMAKVPWAFLNYDDGTLISAEERLLYRDRKDLQAAFPNPFAVETDTGPGFKLWYAADQAAAKQSFKDASNQSDISTISKTLNSTLAPTRRTHPVIRPFLVPMRMMKRNYRRSLKRTLGITFSNYGLKGVLTLVFGR